MVTALERLENSAASSGAKAGDHFFLSGLHTPMTRELTLTSLEVVGEIPRSLDGLYARIGPNPISPPNPAAHHWFLGEGMVHGVRLKQGRAQWYKNRWVRSKAVSKALGEPEAPGPRHFSDVVNTNVASHAGKIWALVEAGGYPVELGPDLETISHNPFEGSLKGSFTAHMHLDHLTGEQHAICYYALDPTTVRHVVVGREGRVVRDEPIAVTDGPSIHDCMITKNFVLVLDLPVTFSEELIRAGKGFPYRWNPKHKSRVGVLGRNAKGTDIVWCDVPPCYVFHPCNAYENGDGQIVLDLCVHDSMFRDSTIGPDSRTVSFERWTIDPAARSVSTRVLDSQPQEFPRLDERLTGRPYRYAYAMSLKRDETYFNADQYLIKHDLQTGSKAVHDFGSGRVPGEFVFVPRTPVAPEDDGWLMGYVLDPASGTTDLIILDAREFAGSPVAKIRLPHIVPPGFHGNWIASGA